MHLPSNLKKKKKNLARYLELQLNIITNGKQICLKNPAIFSPTDKYEITSIMETGIHVLSLCLESTSISATLYTQPLYNIMHFK